MSVLNLVNSVRRVKINGYKCSAANWVARTATSCSHESLIPKYQRFNEDFKTKKARLLYQSRKRGMLENDLLLSTFAHRYLDKFSEKELDLYDGLINNPSNDWDLYYWIVGKKATPSEYNNTVMDVLKDHAKNVSKENRTRQPSLY